MRFSLEFLCSRFTLYNTRCQSEGHDLAISNPWGCNHSKQWSTSLSPIIFAIFVAWDELLVRSFFRICLASSASISRLLIHCMFEGLDLSLKFSLVSSIYGKNTEWLWGLLRHTILQVADCLIEVVGLAASIEVIFNCRDAKNDVNILGLYCLKQVNNLLLWTNWCLLADSLQFLEAVTEFTCHFLIWLAVALNIESCTVNLPDDSANSGLTRLGSIIIACERCTSRYPTIRFPMYINPWKSTVTARS